MNMAWLIIHRLRLTASGHQLSWGFFIDVCIIAYQNTMQRWTENVENEQKNMALFLHASIFDYLCMYHNNNNHKNE